MKKAPQKLESIRHVAKAAQKLKQEVDDAVTKAISAAEKLTKTSKLLPPERKKLVLSSRYFSEIV